MIENKKVKILFLSILILKCILLIYSMLYKNVPMTGVDWGNFNTWAKNLSMSDKSLLEILVSGGDLFTCLTGVIYRIFGENPNQMYVFNFAMSLIVFKYLYKTILVLGENKVKAMIGSMFFFIWPIEVILSVAFLREMSIQALVIISCYNFVKFIKESKYLNIFGAILSIMLACMMHSGVVCLLLLYILYMAFYQSEGKIKILSFKRILSFFLVMILIFLTPLADKVLNTMSGINMRKRIVSRIELSVDKAVANINNRLASMKEETQQPDQKNSLNKSPNNAETSNNSSISTTIVTSDNKKTETQIKENKPEKPKTEVSENEKIELEKRKKAEAEKKKIIKELEKSDTEVITNNLMKKTSSDYRWLKGNTSYIKSNPTNIKEAILQIPYRLVNFVFAPFIWQVYDLSTFASFLFDGILQLFIWFTIIKWVVFDKERSKKTMFIKITLLLMIIGTYFIFSWGTYTYGAAIRHRTKILPIIVAIVTVTYDWEKLFKKIKVVK